jgi:chaperone modulatory protein CbpM
MVASDQQVFSGTILGDEGVLSLADITRACAIHADYVVELVEEGVVAPTGQDPVRWRFSASCLIKIRKAVRLQNDLGVNVAGIALALQLMDEMETLRQRLRSFPEHRV